MENLNLILITDNKDSLLVSDDQNSIFSRALSEYLVEGKIVDKFVINAIINLYDKNRSGSKIIDRSDLQNWLWSRRETYLSIYDETKLFDDGKGNEHIFNSEYNEYFSKTLD